MMGNVSMSGSGYRTPGTTPGAILSYTGAGREPVLAGGARVAPVSDALGVQKAHAISNLTQDADPKVQRDLGDEQLAGAGLKAKRVAARGRLSKEQQ
jgi:hypothetical protein